MEPEHIQDILVRLVRENEELKTRIGKLEEFFNPADRIVTCTEAAHILDKSLGTISNYIRHGRLHKVCRNGMIGIEIKEVWKQLER